MLLVTISKPSKVPLKVIVCKKKTTMKTVAIYIISALIKNL